jgi:hypothetical protein
MVSLGLKNDPKAQVNFFSNIMFVKTVQLFLIMMWIFAVGMLE